MANIMMNKVCNLQCPYCFANRFVNTTKCIDENNITRENFLKALDFNATSPGERVGIIGGEPLLHPQFEEFMEILFDDDRFDNVTVFTNGINIMKHPNIFANSKVSVLINLNSPKDIGEKNYEKIMEGLDYLVNNLYLGDKISLGINMYKPNFDYEYMLRALEKFGMKRVRTAIVAPNSEEKRGSNPLDYFREMKPRVFEFFSKLECVGVVPTYDCNNMPTCVLTDYDRRWLYDYVERMHQKTGIWSNIEKGPICSPVIDILQNLEAVRCFGCSDFKVPISKFDNLNDLRNFLSTRVDNCASLVSTVEDCKTCYEKHTGKCTGGCLAFKDKKIKKLWDIVEDIENER